MSDSGRSSLIDGSNFPTFTGANGPASGIEAKNGELAPTGARYGGATMKEGFDMRLFKCAMVGAIAVSMAATSAIAAGPTRSTAALPGVHKAPVSGLRASTPLKHKSNQSDEGTPVLGYALAAVVGAGIIAATIAATNDDSNTGPDSAG